MNVLVLDDSDERHAWFQANLSNVTSVRTVPEAIRALETESYGMVCLDHDLGTEPAVGRDVARWLIQHAEYNPLLTVIIQSVNAVSGPKMARELTEAGRRAWWIPFPKLPHVLFVNEDAHG